MSVHGMQRFTGTTTELATIIIDRHIMSVKGLIKEYFMQFLSALLCRFSTGHPVTAGCAHWHHGHTDSFHRGDSGDDDRGMQLSQEEGHCKRRRQHLKGTIRSG